MKLRLYARTHISFVLRRKDERGQTDREQRDMHTRDTKRILFRRRADEKIAGDRDIAAIISCKSTLRRYYYYRESNALGYSNARKSMARRGRNV